MTSSYDTLDDIDESCRTYEWLHENFLRHLQSYVGVVITGMASPAIASDKNEWGQPIANVVDNVEERLYMRVHPPGLLANAATDTPRVIIVTSRRVFTDGDETTIFILWPRVTIKNTAITIQLMTEGSVGVTSARNVHLMIPSIFSHHHKEPEDATVSSCKYPVYDPSHYHALRPTTFSIQKAMEGHGGMILSAPGNTAWMMTSLLSGAECLHDVPLRLAEPIAAMRWTQLQQECIAKIQEKVGQHETLENFVNAHAICDVLTGEGILGLLCCEEIVDGGMPDMLFLPGGFPLLITFAVRVAAYPERFGLARPSEYDAMAIEEANAFFESAWPTIELNGKGVYAIDLAIRTSLESARETEDNDAAFKQSNDCALFFQRAGQRIVNVVFGLDPTEIKDDELCGSCNRLIDPLEVARNRTLEKIGFESDDKHSLLPTSFSNHTKSLKRRKLLELMHDVELWLRTGTYKQMQIHSPNENFAYEVNKQPTPQELQSALKSSVKKSVDELVARGEVRSAKQASKAAAYLKKNLSKMLRKKDGSLDQEALQALMTAEGAQKLESKEEEQRRVENSMRRVVNLDAFQQAVSCLSVGLSNGVLVTFQFNLTVWLSYEGATNACPDCGDATHVLGATLLTSRHAACTHCRKRRCYKCALAARSEMCVSCMKIDEF